MVHNCDLKKHPWLETIDRGVKFRSLFVFTLFLLCISFLCLVFLRLRVSVCVCLSHACSLGFISTRSPNREMSGVLSRSFFWDRCQLETKYNLGQQEKKILQSWVLAANVSVFLCLEPLHDGSVPFEDVK